MEETNRAAFHLYGRTRSNRDSVCARWTSQVARCDAAKFKIHAALLSLVITLCRPSNVRSFPILRFCYKLAVRMDVVADVWLLAQRRGRLTPSYDARLHPSMAKSERRAHYLLRLPRDRFRRAAEPFLDRPFS